MVRAERYSGNGHARAEECALVTGAASGIGREFALALARRGENLLLVDRAGEPLNDLSDDLAQRHQIRTECFVTDLGHFGTALELFKYARRKHLRVATLINCAAVATRQQLVRQPLDSISEEIDVNVTAVIQLIRVFLPWMIRQGRGTIVNVGSVAAFQRVPSMAVYAGSKSFLHSLTESLAMELEGTGVYVADLCPGVTRTPFLDTLGLDPSEVPSSAQTPSQVVEEALVAIDQKRELIVTGFSNRVRVWTDTLTPRRAARVVKNSIRRIFGAI